VKSVGNGWKETKTL